MENILQFAVNALSLGGVYAMLAIGIALIAGAIDGIVC